VRRVEGGLFERRGNRGNEIRHGRSFKERGASSLST
jgi:hypothetical protein